MNQCTGPSEDASCPAWLLALLSWFVNILEERIQQLEVEIAQVRNVCSGDIADVVVAQTLDTGVRAQYRARVKRAFYLRTVCGSIIIATVTHWITVGVLSYV